MEATAVQLHRMEFTPHPNLSYESLTENGKEIYDELVKRYNLPKDRIMGTRHFTEEQIKELETIFGLKRIESLPVRDGIITRNQKLWWRSEDGPELVSAENQWLNIKSYPDLYQLNPPKIKYED